MNVEAAPTNEQPLVPEIEPQVEVPTQTPTTAAPVQDNPDPQVEPTQPLTDDSPVTKVVDMRTHTEELESVDEDAHKLTKAADEEEADFIHHVEEVHTIK